MQRVVFGFLLLSISFLTARSWAFPEMIRMGYVNCTSCHVSPTGGGLLTDYGRSTSNEVLSTWAKPKEELFGHGLIPEPPAWLKLGGDFRSIQTYVQSVGVQGGPEGSPFRGELMAHRMYALYN